MSKPTATPRRSRKGKAPIKRCPYCDAPTVTTLLGRVVCVGRSANGCGNTVREAGASGKFKLGVHY